MNGGERIAAVLKEQGVRFLFTLCGGHISPILVGAKALGIRVVDVRHEVDAVFAADAVFRLTGVPGVAAVTAGPGVTNTLTAVKNAQLAQSALVLLGGAAATLLKGRGALQDIDQRALIEPHVKWVGTATAVRDLAPMLEKAFAVARSGVPGPVFLECPVDLLYGEELVRQWYGASAKGGGLAGAALRLYMKRHARKLFAGADRRPAIVRPAPPPEPDKGDVRAAAARLRKAKRPVLVLGGQVLLTSPSLGEARELARAVEAIGAPVYLAGGARGLLGPGHPLQMRHKRREALREADLVLLAGIPSDFRLDYGRHVGRKAFLLSVNRSEADLRMNRKPDLGVNADPGLVLRGLAAALGGGERPWGEWLAALRARDAEREREIDAQAAVAGERVNPVQLCREIDRALADDSVIVADGGDFVATAAYTVSPRAPLSWLDPGVFGTLGVGGGFALGAKLCRPEADVWILYGDGSAAYSLAEFDTFARHGVPVIAVVGNDAGWTQIAREQIEILHDDVGVVLARTDYHRVAEGYGGRGLLLVKGEDAPAVLRQAVEIARAGAPVLVNAHLDKTEFRKGSISM